MATNGREKGARFEREIARAITEATGLGCKRLIEQYRSGGLPGDLEGPAVTGFAIECKRHARAQPAMLRKWREQAMRQGLDHGREPVLIYREDRRPVKVNRWSAGEWVDQDFVDFLADLRQNSDINRSE